MIFSPGMNDAHEATHADGPGDSTTFFFPLLLVRDVRARDGGLFWPCSRTDGMGRLWADLMDARRGAS